MELQKRTSWKHALRSVINKKRKRSEKKEDEIILTLLKVKALIWKFKYSEGRVILQALHVEAINFNKKCPLWQWAPSAKSFWLQLFTCIDYFNPILQFDVKASFFFIKQRICFRSDLVTQPRVCLQAQAFYERELEAMKRTQQLTADNLLAWKRTEAELRREFQTQEAALQKTLGKLRAELARVTDEARENREKSHKLQSSLSAAESNVKVSLKCQRVIQTNRNRHPSSKTRQGETTPGLISLFNQIKWLALVWCSFYWQPTKFALCNWP